MKLACLIYLMCFFAPLSMKAKEAPQATPETIQLASEAIVGKSDTEQLESLSLWKKQTHLRNYCEAQLDMLYDRSKALVEEYAQSSNGDASVRASCFELLRRHHNFAVTLQAQDLKLTMPITGYEITHSPGLIDFRREWTLYRIAAAPNPQAKLEELKAQELHNSFIFEHLSIEKQINGKAPEAKPTTSTPWSIIVVLIVAACGLLRLLLKRRS